MSDVYISPIYMGKTSEELKKELDEVDALVQSGLTSREVGEELKESYSSEMLTTRRKDIMTAYQAALIAEGKAKPMTIRMMHNVGVPK